MVTPVEFIVAATRRRVIGYPPEFRYIITFKQVPPVSIKSIVIFLVTLIYIISPIDLIPDYIIGLGQIDDVAILGVSLYFLEIEFRKYRECKDR